MSNRRYFISNVLAERCQSHVNTNSTFEFKVGGDTFFYSSLIVISSLVSQRKSCWYVFVHFFPHAQIEGFLSASLHAC